MVVLRFTYEVFVAYKSGKPIDESLMIVGYNPNWYLYCPQFHGKVD